MLGCSALCAAGELRVPMNFVSCAIKREDASLIVTDYAISQVGLIKCESMPDDDGIDSRYDCATRLFIKLPCAKYDKSISTEPKFQLAIGTTCGRVLVVDARTSSPVGLNNIDVTSEDRLVLFKILFHGKVPDVFEVRYAWMCSYNSCDIPFSFNVCVSDDGFPEWSEDYSKDRVRRFQVLNSSTKTVILRKDNENVDNYNYDWLAYDPNYKYKVCIRISDDLKSQNMHP